MEKQSTDVTPGYKEWPTTEYDGPSELSAYILKLKERLLGKRLENVFILHPKTGDTPISARWRTSLHTNHPADLPFVLRFSGEPLAVWFYDGRQGDHKIKIGQETAQLGNYSGFFLKDFSRYFRGGVIGAALKDIFVRTNWTYPCLDHMERYAHRPPAYYEKETVEEIIFLFDNGQRLILAERTAAERSSVEPSFKSTDCRMMVGEPPFRRDGTNISFEGGDTIDDKHEWCPLKKENAILIWDDDLSIIFYAVMLLEFPEFDKYEYFVVKKEVWLRALTQWKFILEADNLDQILELFKTRAATDKENADRIMWMVNTNGERIWKERDSHRTLYENFRAWLEEQLKTHDRITVRGY